MQQLIYCGLIAIGIFVGIGLTVLAMKLCDLDPGPEESDDDDEFWG